MGENYIRRGFIREGNLKCTISALSRTSGVIRDVASTRCVGLCRGIGDVRGLVLSNTCAEGALRSTVVRILRGTYAPIRGECRSRV